MTESNEIQLENVNCPRCNSAKSLVVVKGNDFIYKVRGEFYASECSQCKLWFQNPRPVAAHIHKLYPTTYTPHAAIDKNRKQKSSLLESKYLKKQFGYTHLNDPTGFNWQTLPVFNFVYDHFFGVGLVPRFVPNGKLLEIGCASGERLLKLREMGWQNLYGIELIEEAVEKARQEGLSVMCGQIEDTIENYPDNYFDVILTSMVLEHLFNPFDILEKIAKKLKPRGQLLFSTVTRDSIDGKLYKEFWAGFDFPRHMVFFKKKDLISSLIKNYDHIEVFHQNAPIDFYRASSCRIESHQGTFLDEIIVKISKSKISKLIGYALAWMGLTTRISIRCTKK